MSTPLGRVRHFGSAHHGTGHFWMLRLSAAAGLLLTIAAIIIVVSAIGRPHGAVVALLGAPFVTAIMVMFIATVTMHMWLGMQEIIVDYAGSETAKRVWLIANTFFSIAVAVIAILAILRIAF